MYDSLKYLTPIFMTKPSDNKTLQQQQQQNFMCRHQQEPGLPDGKIFKPKSQIG
jgi:hypothetical protein